MVVADDDRVRIAGVHPQRVEVAARGLGHVLEGAPAIDRAQQEAHVRRREQPVRVRGMGDEVRVVERTRQRPLVPVDEREAGAGVVGAIQAGFSRQRFHERPHTLGPGRRDGDGDLARDACGQSLLEPAPGVAAVRRLEEAAAGSAARQGPGLAHDFPECRVEHARRRFVQGQVHGAGLLADKEDALPAAPAVARAIHAPLRIRTERVPEDRGVHEVGILRMHAQPADLPRVAQASVPPRAAGVVRAIDAVAG